MKRVLRGALLVLPFLALGGVFLYLGSDAPPGSLTDDGYPLDTFYYAMGAWFIGLPLALSLIISLLFVRAASRQRDLVEHGIKGTARIMQTEQTGTFVNNNPQVRFKLLIELPDRPPYEVPHLQIVDLIHLGAINPGSSLGVYVDPENSRNLLLDL